MKPYSLDLRQKIIDAHKSGAFSQRQLARRFSVALSFIQSLLKRYRDTGSIAPKVRSQQTPTKLNTEQLSILKELVETHNDATLRELCDLLASKTDVSISISTMDRMLKKLNITSKKKTFHASEKESDRVQAKRVEFWDLVRAILAANLIFIDESGVNLALTRLNARSEKGQRAHGTRPQKRGKNVSLIAALGLEGIVAQATIGGSVDGITFEAFIANRLVPNLWPGAYVIMDNCRIHFGERIEELIRQAGAHLIYLPPYSPEFSPIENMWSKVKSILRSIGARTYSELAQAIEEAYKQISIEDIKGWFTHCCYCTSPD